MESLVELCDLISQNPSQFPEKIAWICSRCPPAESLLSGSPRVSRSQLHAILTVARLLSKCPNSDHETPKSLVLAFYRSIPSSFNPKFWPQAFSSEAISSFFNDFLSYMSKAAEQSPDFASDVAGFTGEIVIQTISNADSSVSRVLLKALCSNFPPILPSDVNKLISVLLDRFEIPVPSSPREVILATPDAASAQSSPLSVNHYQSPGVEVSIISADSSSSAASKDDGSSSREIVVNGGGSITWRSNGDIFGASLGFADGDRGSGASTVAYKKAVTFFEEESVESLEKQEIVFKLIGHVFSKALDPQLVEQVRGMAKDQLESMLAFLKIRKRDWSEQGQLLKIRINRKLSVYQAATNLQIKSLASLDTEGKSSKRLLHGALALLIEAAEACLFSVWRKLRACEELFSCLLSGISQAAVTRGGQLLRVLLIRFKPLVLATCAQADTWASSHGGMFESVLKTCCEIIEFGWAKDRSPVDTFIMGLATSIRERSDYDDEDGKGKLTAPPVQLNVIRLLAELNVSVSKPEVVDMILPLFIESLEEGDASTPGLLRLRLLDAVSRMATLGFEKSYREAVVLMTRSYLGKLSSVGSAESKTQVPEATTERVETLPAGFLLIARGITSNKLRSDYRHRLLSLCSDVGLAAESKSGRSGADFLGPLLPAVAEICSDFDPTVDMEPSILKLFRNLWFYIALFGLAPPIQKTQGMKKSVSTTLNSVGSMGTTAIQAVGGPYMWNSLWSSAVQRISQGTPPLVVSSVKWLEDELELNALHNPGSRRGSGNEKAAVGQRAALSAALGGRVEVSAMSTISGVKATYLLAVAFLEIIRFSSNGGILNGAPSSTASRSAFGCVFEYLRSPNLMPAVSQCLTAIVHQAFETALTWLILWNSSCLDSLLLSMHNDPSPAVVTDPAYLSNVRSLYQKIVREWIVVSLSHAPCTSQGLLQENLCKANTWQRTQPTADVVSLLSEIRIGTSKNDCWIGTKTANIPAVMAAAAAASGGNLNFFGCLDLPFLGSSAQPPQPKNESFNEILLCKFVRLLQKFVNIAEKGEEVDKKLFRETCSQATALLLSNLDSDPKSNIESFSQLLRLLCWCPAYITTPDAMETGVYIWTWLVSAAPQLGSLVLAELVVRHDSVEQLLLLGRMLQGTTKLPWKFSRHPAATGAFFTFMLFGLKFCSCRTQGNLQNFRSGLQLLEDRIYRASLGWFAHEPEWYDLNNKYFAQTEAQSVSLFVHHLLNERGDMDQLDQRAGGNENGSSMNDVTDQYHPVWGQMGNYASGREKRRQLLLMLCQHEADRLEVWAQPVGPKESTSRLKISSEKWIEFARTAFSVDPRIALSLAARFPSNSALKSEITQLVQSHILEIRAIPEALPYFVTRKQWMRIRHLCNNCRTGQLVQLHKLWSSLLQLIKGETCVPESGKDAASITNNSFQALLPVVRQRIVDGFNPKAFDVFQREFDFFDKVTSISGVLFPLPKEERRAGIRRELENIQVEGDDLYLPTAPNKLVRGIQVDSGIPLQSAAKVPIMITFNVVDRDGDPKDIKPQACIFKVGDDCRQDVLALQVISLLKDIFEAVGLNLYLFPYGVLPTGPERGIIEVVPNSRSRSQMGETTDGGLYEIFQQDFGPVGSPSFEAARENFLISSAGYAVASLLLQPKDRHNGNLLFDNVGRLVHIDFGFILETSPGGNMRFESAHFKLSHEMTQLLDPSGVMKSDTWYQFVSLCVKGYLAARRHMDGIINTVLLMMDSGLPCFSRGDPIGNLRKRFHPEMSEREAANFMIRTCTDAYNKWTTAGYDLIQYLQQGIEK
ncbi:UNVERIFIED_CONTAM: Phosphatidylinositol 4-kinase alpha 1 [Sesamum angustifolium]|uniref:1-phosphatidylinositol 4-kinase n=1 Tax=Sesamum angustifolium TaxID=2727405 RepID=A0AAW2QDW9_9LAMI